MSIGILVQSQSICLPSPVVDSAATPSLRWRLYVGPIGSRCVKSGKPTLLRHSSPRVPPCGASAREPVGILGTQVRNVNRQARQAPSENESLLRVPPRRE